MTLIGSSFSRSTEAALSLTSDHGERDLIDWTNGAKTLQERLICKHDRVGYKRSVQVTERINNCTCSLNNVSSYSQHSTVGTLSENSSRTFVYQRRKLRRCPSPLRRAQASTKKKPSGTSVAEISCEVPSVASKGHLISLVEVENEADRDHVMLPVECDRGALISKLTSIGGCSLAEEQGSVEDPKCDELKNVDACFVNDGCSSSKSKMDVCTTTSKPEVDDTGECSSSVAFVMDGLQDTTSKKDIYISISTVLGINKAVWPNKTCTSPEGIGTNSNCIGLLSCKVCDQPEMTVKMLICDHCEEATHIPCWNPRVKKICRSEWFCHSCLKRYKVLNETSRESLRGNSEMNRYINATSKCALGPIALMLEENEPYTTSVHIGPEFQAEIPDCSGQVTNEIDNTGEPLEIYPSVGLSSQERSSGKNRQSSICNWLQCRQVMDGIGFDGTVCGKWRRAPLFEVQTDNWECFRSFLWDPTHADCAVPQELDTCQVLKDLKYIEMLRPRLAVKKRKFCCTKSSDSKGPQKGARNVGAL